jgi:octaprenyl-diphosphate synthase
MAGDPLERLSSLLGDELALVGALIRERMASEHAPRIPEIAAHLVEAGGKRIRPLLTLAAARLFAGDGPRARKLAAAVEFIHTATLLHDDVVDQSRQRRGRPTANLLWDNKSSVLVGDFLFSRAFRLMVETGSLRVLDILANASAVIAEGEVLQLTAAHDLAMGEAVYIRVIRGKTAALFEAACEAGAVASGADEAAAGALRRYGDALGTAFQIADDLLDYEGDGRRMGKERGDDFRDRKVTLPVILALAAADRDARAFWERAFARGEQRPEDLATARGLLDASGALAGTRTRARAAAAAARAALAPLPRGAVTDLLGEIADYVVSRGS